MLKIIYFLLHLFPSFVNSFQIPLWADNYHVKGTLYVPEANVIEPFEIWYSRRLRKSRADFYDGMVRTYQSLDEDMFGIDYKVVPFTNENQWNIKRCFKRKGEENHPVNLQPALYPIEDLFEYKGDVSVDGNDEPLQKWSRTEFNSARDSLTYDFYTKCSIKNDTGIDCNQPVRLEMNGSNLIFPTHAGYYYIDYELYEPDVVLPHKLQINSPHKCVDLSEYYQERSFSSLSEFLPSISRIVNEDRGFKKFTQKHGNQFASVNEFRKIFNDFRQDLHNLKLKIIKKLDPFSIFKPLDLAANNKRNLINILNISNTKKDSEDSIEFKYTKKDIRMLSKYRYFNLDRMGVMQPIQSQLNCGSCWAFSTVAALEGAYFIKHRKHVKLSEQALIDCSWGFNNFGCDGGAVILALDWIKKHRGIPFYNEYGPYKANDGYCNKQNRTETVRVRKYQKIRSGDFKAVQIALIKNGPVIASMSASSAYSLRYYKNGVYSDPECSSDPNNLDHSVAIVGFGYQNDKLYWIIRNSWSKLWGMNGHAYVAAEKNICGLTTLMIVPFLH